MCNKSFAFRFTELETIVEILVPHIQLESSVTHIGQISLEVRELLDTPDRADRSISAFIYHGVEQGTVCLPGFCLWRHCFTASGQIVAEKGKFTLISAKCKRRKGD